MAAGFEQAERQAVIDVARRWLGTPYHHLGDVPGVGVDCSMLLVRVYVETRLMAPFDPRPYPTDWHLHRSEEKYIDWIKGRAVPTDDPGPGDMVLFRFGRTFSHGGIVVEWPRIIHSAVWEGCVLADASKHPLADRATCFFTLWGEAGPRDGSDIRAALGMKVET